MMFKLENIKKNAHFFSLIFWILAIFSYYFQFPFERLSTFLIPSFCLFLIFEFNNFYIIKDKRLHILFFIYILYLFLMLLYSLWNGIALNRIIRFFTILIIIPICFFIRDKNFNNKQRFFIYLSILKSILLISIAIYLIIKGDHTIIRNYVNTLDMGDIYLTAGGFPKVQVQGNALLLVAFMIDFLHSNKRFNIKNTIILLGVLSAGNFAYILGLFVFFICIIFFKLLEIMKNYKNKKRLLLLLSIFILVLVTPYVKEKLDSKRESNNIKIHQAFILLDGDIIFGEGLGNPIKAQTDNVVYDGNLYFELQTLYIINQIGIIGTFLFYLVTIWQLRKECRVKILLYMVYLFYTFFNPYCFDSTQMITIVCIINMIQGEKEYDNSDYYNILSKIKSYR